MSRTPPRLPCFLFPVLPALIAAAGAGCVDSAEVDDSSSLAVAAISQPIFDANACDEDGTPASLCARADNALSSCFMAMGGASRVRKEVAQVFATDITTAVRLVRFPVRLRSQIAPNDPSELEIEIRPVIDGVVATGGEAAYTFGAVRLRDLPYNTDTDVSVVMAPSGLELTPEGDEGEPLEWALIISVTEGSPGVVGIGCTSSELPGVGRAYQRTQRLILSEWTETAYTRYARTIPFALWFGVADECDYFNGGCGDNATCTNDGSVSCECHDGWTGQGCGTIATTYTASGTIEDSNGNPIPGVTLSFSGTDVTATTDENGQWSQSGLDGTVTVTPTHEDYDFDPISIEVTEAATDVDFVGTLNLVPFAVSGAVLDTFGDPIPGVTVSFGGAAAEVTTDENGEWSQTGLFGSVLVTPSFDAYTLVFAPASRVVSGPDAAVDFTASGKMVEIPAGTFMRGCNIAVDDECFPDEFPYREIDLSAFWIDETEVTQAAYAACVAAGQCIMPSGDWTPVTEPNHPVTSVSWDMAVAYCAWAGKRLPTEAEWEKAARGVDGRKYPWGNANATCQLVSIAGCGNAKGQVGSTPEGDGPYGLKDMAGNVWEWVADWYGSTYYPSAPAGDPFGPASGSYRSVRGGAWGNDARYVRASHRGSYAPGDEASGIGFRCAKDAATYAISGTITDSKDNPIPGVTLTFSGRGVTATTDANGQWSQSKLDGTVTVTPTHEDYDFDPNSLEVTEAATDVDFVGTSIPRHYSVSGRIAYVAGDFLAGVTVSFGGAAESVTTDANGEWSRDGLLGPVTVTPTHDLYAFEPTGVLVEGPNSEVNFTGMAADSIVGEVLVPAGPFWRGCNEDIDTQCSSWEKPGGEITLSAFWIDTTTVTQSAYLECVNAEVCSEPLCNWGQGASLPVNCVTWEQANNYCEWRNKRLPTEAEWEKAARGTDGRKFPWGNENITCSLANYSSCGFSLKPVGSTPAGASPYGAMDMAGNVWEWVADWFDGDYYGTAPYENPQGPEDGTYRVIRGGRYQNPPQQLRTSHRQYGVPGLEYDHYGFRCARSP